MFFKRIYYIFCFFENIIESLIPVTEQTLNKDREKHATQAGKASTQDVSHLVWLPWGQKTKHYSCREAESLPQGRAHHMATQHLMVSPESMHSSNIIQTWAGFRKIQYLHLIFCLCVYVCVHVSLCVFSDMHGCVCTCMWRSEKNLWCCPSGPAHLVFKVGSLTALVFTKQAGVAGPQAPALESPCLPPSPELLVHSITPVTLDLCSRDLTQVLMLVQ